jgi:hypothetical protein
LPRKSIQNEKENLWNKNSHLSFLFSSQSNDLKRKMHLMSAFTRWLIVLLTINQATGKQVHQLFSLVLTAPSPLYQIQ